MLLQSAAVTQIHCLAYIRVSAAVFHRQHQTSIQNMWHLPEGQRQMTRTALFVGLNLLNLPLPCTTIIYPLVDGRCVWSPHSMKTSTMLAPSEGCEGLRRGFCNVPRSRSAQLGPPLESVSPQCAPVCSTLSLGSRHVPGHAGDVINKSETVGKEKENNEFPLLPLFQLCLLSRQPLGTL